MSDADFFEQTLHKAKQRLKRLEAAEIYQGYTQENVLVYPHCDDRVLHSKGVCSHCDNYPQLQHFRKALGLKFTDELQANDALLPGEDRRSRLSGSLGWESGGPMRIKEKPNTRNEIIHLKKRIAGDSIERKRLVEQLIALVREDEREKLAEAD